jgi:hypothetical protein
MLQALLPQVAECGDQVEVWVLDNASTDDTQTVIEESRKLGPVQSCRNEWNIGPLRNVVKGPCELATGEFVWILGDHNLIRPGALQRVLQILADHPNISLFYSNFRVTRYPDNWPENALGGHDGPFHYSGNPQNQDHSVEKWNELLCAENYYGTQSYVHIVETQIWRSYWNAQDPGDSYLDAKSTYPHTYMLTDVCFDSPAFFIGSEQITIFNGAQSWGHFETQRRVFLLGFAGLVRLFQARGMSLTRVADVKACCTRCVYLGFFEYLQSRPRGIVLTFGQSFVMAGFQNIYLWRPLLRALIDSRSLWPLRLLDSLQLRLQRTVSYITRDCRPARWLRRKKVTPESWRSRIK